MLAIIENAPYEPVSASLIMMEDGSTFESFLTRLGIAVPTPLDAAVIGAISDLLTQNCSYGPIHANSSPLPEMLRRIFETCASGQHALLG